VDARGVEPGPSAPMRQGAAINPGTPASRTVGETGREGEGRSPGHMGAAAGDALGPLQTPHQVPHRAPQQRRPPTPPPLTALGRRAVRPEPAAAPGASMVRRKRSFVTGARPLYPMYWNNARDAAPGGGHNRGPKGPRSQEAGTCGARHHTGGRGSNNLAGPMQRTNSLVEGPDAETPRPVVLSCGGRVFRHWRRTGVFLGGEEPVHHGDHALRRRWGRGRKGMGGEAGTAESCHVEGPM